MNSIRRFIRLFTLVGTILLPLGAAQNANAATSSVDPSAAGHADITVKATSTRGEFSMNIDVAWIPWDYDFLCEGVVYEELKVRCLFCEEIDGSHYVVLCESLTSGSVKTVTGTMLDGDGNVVEAGRGTYDTRSGKGEMSNGNSFTLESSGW